MSGNGKIAMVTGAGSGIGKQTALALIADGYSTVLVGRREDPLKATADESGADPGRALVAPTDVSDPESVTALFAKTEDAFARLDVLFNNAGVNVPSTPIEDLTYEQWKTVVDINLTGSFLCAQAAVRLMKRQDPKGGRIINNGSISAHAPRPDSTPYTTTKHAITGLTKCLSLDGRKHDIACGQIDIGNALTEMAARMTKGVPQANGTIEVEPVMDSTDVARTVVFMASLPLDANIQTVTVMATKMPFVGRG